MREASAREEDDASRRRCAADANACGRSKRTRIRPFDVREAREVTLRAGGRETIKPSERANPLS